MKNQFQKTIAVDFDGTITSEDTKSVNGIPPPRKNAVRVITRWIEEGYVVIINTLRGREDWELQARDYLARYNIPFTYFNENAVERIEAYGDVRKIAADIYVDDRNLGGIPDDFEDIDRFVKAQIGFPYKKSNGTGELVEDKPNLPSSSAQMAVTMFANTGIKARFSDEFNDNANKCPLTNVIYHNIMSGGMTEYQVIEYLVDEVKNSQNQLQQSMITFANASAKSEMN